MVVTDEAVLFVAFTLFTYLFGVWTICLAICVLSNYARKLIKPSRRKR